MKRSGGRVWVVATYKVLAIHAKDPDFGMEKGYIGSGRISRILIGRMEFIILFLWCGINHLSV